MARIERLKPASSEYAGYFEQYAEDGYRVADIASYAEAYANDNELAGMATAS